MAAAATGLSSWVSVPVVRRSCRPQASLYSCREASVSGSAGPPPLLVLPPRSSSLRSRRRRRQRLSAQGPPRAQASGVNNNNSDVADNNNIAPSSFSNKTGTPFYRIDAILRPWRLQDVSSALINVGIRGLTVTDVRGFGSQIGRSERYAGSEFSDAQLVSKVRIEVVVAEDQVDFVVDVIAKTARTGEIGDGKIFIVPIADVIRIRTGERGAAAERMKGGRADQLAQKAQATS
eukprot:jgi/Chlat1/1027/Chrsp109S01463